MCRQRRLESGTDSSGKRFCEKREQRAQNFSGVHVDGVNTEQQRGQCSLGRGEAARVVGEEVREEMGGSIMQGFLVTLRTLAFILYEMRHLAGFEQCSYIEKSEYRGPGCCPLKGLLTRLALRWPLGTWIWGGFPPISNRGVLSA